MVAYRTSERDRETLSHCHGLHFDQTMKRTIVRRHKTTLNTSIQSVRVLIAFYVKISIHSICFHLQCHSSIPPKYRSPFCDFVLSSFFLISANQPRRCTTFHVICYFIPVTLSPLNGVSMACFGPPTHSFPDLIRIRKWLNKFLTVE